MTVRETLSSIIGAVAVILLLATHAFSASQNLGPGGLAIQGYDPVAYFTQNAAIKGKSEFSMTHDGATYHFSSAEHRDLFAAKPSKYIPAYGGYCAYGVAKGQKAPIEPDKFSIVNGKLYLNYNGAVQSLWQKDVPGFISTANENWPRVGG